LGTERNGVCAAAATLIAIENAQARRPINLKTAIGN